MGVVEILTPSQQSRLDVWMHQARNCDAIRGALSTESWWSEKPIPADSWGGFVLMDSDNLALTKISFDRDGALSAVISHWRLPSGGPNTTASHIRKAYRLLCEHNVIWIGATVLADNHKSIAICKKAFGEPWGICREAGWSSRLCRTVDIHHFRCRLPAALP